MNTEHTPGPWHFEPDDRNRGDALDRFVITGGELSDYDDGPMLSLVDFMREADARLIAAAPDLLAALKLILPLAKGYAPDGQTRSARDTCNSWIEIAMAAIARAEPAPPEAKS